MNEINELIVFPPNKPLERLLAPSQIPVRHNYMNFIDINEKGKVFIGCSNLSGAYWEGILYYYENYNAAINDEWLAYYINNASVSDGKFIKNTQDLLITEDDCNIKLLTVVGEAETLKCEDITKTNSRIEQLAVWDSFKAVTCGDTSVTIWDIENKSFTHAYNEYKNYHTDLILSVDINKKERNLFASAAMDKKVLIWDDRMEMPASVLYQNEFCGLTSVSWNPEESEYLVIGSFGGVVYNLDMRYTNDFVNSCFCYEDAVYRTAFNDAKMVGVCGNSAKVVILKIENGFDIIYDNNEHSRYVRGLAWFENILYSCGFDNKIVKHVF